MAIFSELLVNLGLKSSSFDSGMKKARRQTRQTQKSFRSLGRTLDVLNGSFEGTAGAAASLALNIIRRADSFAVLEQRIKAATKETNDFVAVNAELFRISQKTGTAMADTVSTFQGLARVREPLGATNAHILTLTETLLKLGTIGGATTTGMQAGMMQFTQAMSGGVFRAEEVNSILENIPEVGKRIEQTLGLMPGTLRKTSDAGNLLAGDVMQGLLSITQEVNQEYEEFGKSAARSTVSMGNSFDKFIGKLNKITGATEKIRKSLDFLSESLDTLGESESFDDFISKMEKLGLKVESLPIGIRALVAIISTLESTDTFAPPSIGFLDDIITKVQPLMDFKKQLMEDGGIRFIGESPFKPEIEKLEADMERINQLNAAIALEDGSLKKTRPELLPPEPLPPAPPFVARPRIIDAPPLPTTEPKFKGTAELPTPIPRRDPVPDMRRQNEELQRLIQSYSMGAQAADEMRLRIDMENAARTENVDLSSQQGIAWQAQFEKGQQLRGGLRDIEESSLKSAQAMQEMADGVGASFQRAFDSAVLSGEKFSDVLKGLAMDIAKLVVQQQVSKPLAAGVSSFMGDIFSSMDFFADGGRPSIGRPSVVGERGPELFVPDASGTILPNGAAMAGGGGNKFATINLTVNALDPRGVAELLVGQKRVLRGLVNSMFNESGKNGPMDGG